MVNTLVSKKILFHTNRTCYIKKGFIDLVINLMIQFWTWFSLDLRSILVFRA